MKTRVSSKINNKKDRLPLLAVGAMRYLSSALNGARFPPFNRATTYSFLFSLPTLPFFIVVCAAYLLLCPRQLHLSHTIYTHKNTWLRRERRKLLSFRSYHILFFCFLRFLGRTPPHLFFYFENSTDSFNDNWIVRKKVEKGKTNRIGFVVRLQRKNKGKGGFFFGVIVAVVGLLLDIHCSTAFSPSHFPHLKAPFCL